MSSNLPPALQPAEPGEPIRAAAWNAVVEALRTLVPSGYDLVRGPAGVALVQRARRGGVVQSVWAKITVSPYLGSKFKAKLLDDDGDMMDPELIVQVFAARRLTTTFDPIIATEFPWLVAGQVVLIEERTTGFMQGWFLVPPNVTTCAG